MELFNPIYLFLFGCILFILHFYLLSPFILVLIHQVFPCKKYSVPSNHEKDLTKLAIIVTAHRDLRFIPPLIDSFKKQSNKNCLLYIIADDCPKTNFIKHDESVIILWPENPLNSKIRSINFAIKNFIELHKFMVILDSDNLIHPFYVESLRKVLDFGFSAVQTHMLSKNTESQYAKLDTLGHTYYTYTERKIKMELGLHSAILGLGIALDTKIYQDIQYHHVLGGFDKKLQAQVAIRITQIGFAENAIVYDEKVEEGITLEKQRTRWIFTYFKHFKDSRMLFLSGIKTRHLGRILLGLSMLRPPLFLLILATLISIILGIMTFTWIAILTSISLIIFAFTFIYVITTQSPQKGIATSMILIPELVFRQLKAILKIGHAKRSFLKTEHSRITYIDEIIH